MVVEHSCGWTDGRQRVKEMEDDNDGTSDETQRRDTEIMMGNSWKDRRVTEGQGGLKTLMWDLVEATEKQKFSNLAKERKEKAVDDHFLLYFPWIQNTFLDYSIFETFCIPPTCFPPTWHCSHQIPFSHPNQAAHPLSTPAHCWTRNGLAVSRGPDRFISLAGLFDPTGERRAPSDVLSLAERIEPKWKAPV